MNALFTYLSDFSAALSTGLGHGLATVATFWGFLWILLGVIAGIIIGATPGLSPAMGVALLVPLSFTMDPAHAFLLFVATYQAANYGGSITAIAINTPGTPSSAVTALDGYPLTTRGKARTALTLALKSSTLGGLLGACILIAVAAPLAQVALAFGPAEYCALAVFGLSSVAMFGKGNSLKTIIAVTLGLLLYCVRADSFTGDPRFTFDLYELYDGIPFIPTLIGLFALGELLVQMDSPSTGAEKEDTPPTASEDSPETAKLTGHRKVLLRSSLIGTGIGVIPGAGATVASFVAYGQAKRSSKTPQSFGKGAHEGIIASEAANSSSVGGALVPLLSLGIPGSATDAVLLGALTLHGLVAGPELFQREPGIVYGMFIALLVANALIYLVGRGGNKLWLKIVSLQPELLRPVVMLLCFVGSYTYRNNIFDLWVCLAAGVLGWLLRKGSYQPAAVVLGLVLGPMLEENFRRTLLMGSPLSRFASPLCILLLGATLVSLLAPLVRNSRRKRVTA